MPANRPSNPKSESMPTILFVTEIQPCPPYGGQMIRCHNVIDSLSQCFSTVVCAPQVATTCRLMTQVTAWYQLPSYDRQSLPSRASNYFHRLVPRTTWAHCLQKIYQQHKPQVVWFSSGHWGQYATVVHGWNAWAIMETYNAQADLTQQAYQATLFGRTRCIRWFRYCAQRIHEQYLFSRFDRIVSVSEADRHYHARYVGEERSLLIPNYLKEAEYIPQKPVKRSDRLVVMTGNFAAFQNKCGLDWFLQQVWPDVCQEIPGIRLLLVGKNSDEMGSRLGQISSIAGTGQVQTVVPYLQLATVVVVPLLHGSGTSFKVLEALACRAPVVSTTLGARGLDLGESIVIADRGPDFAQAIVSLIENAPKRLSLAQNGLRMIRSQHSFALNTERIRQLVIGLTAE
jgi:glycosyltransferase involved in cell wall biosynthesis